MQSISPRLNYAILSVAGLLGLYFIFTNPALTLANIFLLTSFATIFLVETKHKTNSKKVMSGLAAYLIFSLIIYEAICSNSSSFLALILTCTNLGLIFFLFQKHNRQEVKINFDKTVSIAFLALMLIMSTSSILFLIDAASQKNNLDQVKQDINNTLQSDNNSIYKKTNMLLSDNIAAGLISKGNYKDLAAYTQNEKVANDLDYVVITDLEKRIIVNAQNAYDIGNAFPGTIPDEDKSEFVQIDGKIYLASALTIYEDSKAVGKVIAGELIDAKRIKSLAAKKDQDINGVILSYDNKAIDQINSDPNLSYLIAGQSLIPEMTLDKKIKSINYKGGNYLFYGEKLIEINGKDLSVYFLMGNVLLAKALLNFVIILCLLFIVFIVFLRKNYLKQIITESKLEESERALSSAEPIRHLSLKKQKILAKKFVAAYKKFWLLLGDTSVLLLATFIMLGYAFNFNLTNVYSRADKEINIATSANNQTIQSNSNFTILPSEPYLTINNETEVKLSSTPLALNEISVDLSYDSENLAFVDHYDKNYSCKALDDKANIHLDCSKENTAKSFNDNSITVLKFKPIKNGFASINLSRLTTFDNQGQAMQLALPKISNFAFWIE